MTCGDIRFGASCLVRRLELDEVTRLLAARGHTVYTPTLTGLGERAHLASHQTGMRHTRGQLPAGITTS